MSKYGYAGKMLDKRFKEKERQERIKDNQQDSLQFAIFFIISGCIAMLSIIVIPFVLFSIF